MKVLKLIGGVLLGLLVIFLAAGLIMPNINYQVDVTVKQPLEKTWQAFTDISKVPQWIPDVQEIEVLEQVPGEVGSRYRLAIKREEELITVEETILEYIEKEKIIQEFSTESMTRTVTVRFKEEGANSTMISNEVKATGTTYLNRCLFAFMRNQFKKMDQAYLENFKELME